MPNNKKYANQTGVADFANSSSAKGSWVSPSEINKQRAANQWPVVLAGATYQPGDIVYFATIEALSAASGESNNWYPCDGSTVNDSDGSNLQPVISGRFGGTQGFNFVTPPMMTLAPYVKGVTAQSNNPATVLPSGRAILPTHTHSLRVGGQGSSPQASNGNGGATNRPSFTFTSSNNTNSPTNSETVNNGRRVELVPAISNSTGVLPIGSIFPYLPANSATPESPLPTNAVMCTGQLLSNTEYATLFSYLGTTYGSSGGNFRVPDMRGVFVSAVQDGTFTVPGGTGYEEDSFARHNHSVTAYRIAGGNRRCDQTELATAATTPASGNSSIGSATENRPKNISVAFAIIVSA